jgi:hypothetical protein
MPFFWLYGFIFVAAIIWVTLDKYAPGAFEFFYSSTHECARAMGMYGEWIRYSLGRLAFLSILVAMSLMATHLAFYSNPLELRPLSRWVLLSVMLTGSLLLIALPQLASRLRFIKLIYTKSAMFSELSTQIFDDTEFKKSWELADYATEHQWTAWHPKMEDVENYERDPRWKDMVPVIYLRQGKQQSLVATTDFEYFLAWNWLREVDVAEALPFTGPGDTRFFLRSIRQLPGRPGWTVIHAEMEDFEDELIA